MAQDYKAPKVSTQVRAEFIVDWMKCTGPRVAVTNKPNANVNFLALKFGSYLTQKDTHDLSTEPYAHTLRWEEEYGSSVAEAEKKLQNNKPGVEYAQYEAPLVFNELGHIVVVDPELSGFGPIDLEMTGSKDNVTTFKGTFGSVENKYGKGYHEVTCQGVMVAEPTRRIDATNVCRRMAKETVLTTLAKQKINCTATARADYKNKKLNTFFVTARCNDSKRYSYTVETTPNKKDKKSCAIISSTPTLTVNLHE